MADDPPKGERKKAAKPSSHAELISKGLVDAFKETLAEPIPDEMLRLLGKLDDKDADKRGQ